LSAAGPERAPAGPLRLFFALWPTPEERRLLAQASAVAAASCGGRPIPAGNLHLTLAFLGNVEHSRLGELRALGHEFAPAPAFIRLASLQHWPRPQILCATAPDSAEAAVIAALAARLRRATLASGFAPDLKPFRPHVTVARQVVHAPAEQPMACVSWTCAAFALLASSAGSGGPTYSVIESYSLDSGENARK
jgi:RNA 2',3'-cyclic 3'-phosphodiesterase